jgi:hypothetical protein
MWDADGRGFDRLLPWDATPQLHNATFHERGGWKLEMLCHVEMQVLRWLRKEWKF